MKKSMVVSLFVVAFALSGCSVVGSVLGMVPGEELQAANQRVTELEAQLAERDAALEDAQQELTSAASQVSVLEEQVGVLEGENEELAARNGSLELLVCTDHTWDEWNSVGVWGPEFWFDEAYEEAFITLQNSWRFIPQLTQWTPINQLWRDDLPADLLVWDWGSMVWNVNDHCFILDPLVYRDLGK